jgi:hypothetical protein
VSEQAFDPVELDHVPGERHFRVRVASPGPVERVEVIGPRGAVLASAQRLDRARALGLSTAAAAPWARVERDGAGLVVRWNAEATPYASVVLQVRGTRRVLALDATGGEWRVPAESLADLPAGGELELSLSDGVDAQRVRLARP